MHFPFFTSKRRAVEEDGKHAAEKASQQSPGQARLGWTPTPKGQLETERLLAGDAHAADDLKALLDHAGHVSRQVPLLNLNVRATDRWLQQDPDAIEDLVEEQEIAQMHLRKAVSQQLFGFNLMRTASLVGEPFKQSCRELFDDSLSSSTEVNKTGECRGHWRLHYCSGGECCNVVTVEDTEGCAKRPVSNSKSEEVENEEEEEEFPFDDYFADEEKYQQALCEVTALAAKPAPAKVIFIPARTASLRRKRGQNSLREHDNTDHTGSFGATPSERWSTQAAAGSRGSLSESQGEAAPDEDVPQEMGARRSVRLSMTAGPMSGPPATSLPPNPPAHWHLRSSWPLPNTLSDTAGGILYR